MRTRFTILCLALALLLAGALPALAAADLKAALDYLKTQQNADGGFGNGMSPESSLSSTADAVLAIVAGGGAPNDWSQADNTPLTYLSAKAPAATSGGDLAKLILAATAVGENPRSFGGVDSVAGLEALTGTDGRIGGATDTFFSHCLAVVALAAAQRPIAPEAQALIENAQQDSGGWAWDGTAATPADTNTTALAVQALAAAGQNASGPAIAQAMAYYKGIQNTDGGWPYQNPSDYGTATDANSTAVVIQAILAAGQDPAGAEWQTAGGLTPVAALEAFQNESGAFAWQAAMPDDNLLATVQAIPALAGKAFPLATMDVGPAAATPSAATTPPPAPASTAAPLPVMPTSGGSDLPWGLVLVVGGTVMAALGYAAQRRLA